MSNWSPILYKSSITYYKSISIHFWKHLVYKHIQVTYL